MIISEVLISGNQYFAANIVTHVASHLIEKP